MAIWDHVTANKMLPASVCWRKKGEGRKEGRRKQGREGREVTLTSYPTLLTNIGTEQPLVPYDFLCHA